MRQSVSWAKAAQTGSFTSLQEASDGADMLPGFDFDLIDNLHQLIVQGEEGWEDYFRATGKHHVDVFYEDLVENLDASLGSIFSACGLDKPRPVLLSDIKYQKQADAVNEEWVQRYLRELEVR